MAEPDRGPIYGPASRALGAERFERVILGLGQLNAQVTLAVVSVSMIAGMREYADDQLDALVTDAQDVATAAIELATFLTTLAGDWKAQRQELES
jgi:hypothetical protein